MCVADCDERLIAWSGSILSLKNPVTMPVYLPTPVSGALPLGSDASPSEVCPFSPFSAAFETNQTGVCSLLISYSDMCLGNVRRRRELLGII